MLRIIFRSILVATLALFAVIRASKTSISTASLHALSYWMIFTGFLAVVFLIYSAVLAAKNPAGRRLYVRDMMLAIIWLIFWVLSLGRG